MPETSSFVDAFTAEFGAVHVIYANENGCEWNSPDMTKVNKAVPIRDMECWHDAGRRSAAVGNSVPGRRVRNSKVGR